MEGKWRYVALTAIAPVAWGSTYFVTSEFLPADYPLWGAALRALPAGLLLLLIARRLPRGSWWWKSMVLGLCNMSIFFALVYISAQLLPSSVASVIMALAPVAMMVTAFALLSERPGLLPALGAVLGIGGVCAMLLTGTETLDWRGVVASGSAMLMSSVGFVLAKRWSSSIPVLASTSWQLTAGGLMLVLGAVVFEGGPPAMGTSQVLAFAYLSLIATAVASMAWFTGLRHLPAGSVGLIGLLNPVTGVVLGLLLASETLSALQVGGLVLVLVGIAIGQRRRSPVAGPAAVPPATAPAAAPPGVAPDAPPPGSADPFECAPERGTAAHRGG